MDNALSPVSVALKRVTLQLGSSPAQFGGHCLPELFDLTRYFLIAGAEPCESAFNAMHGFGPISLLRPFRGLDIEGLSDPPHLGDAPRPREKYELARLRHGDLAAALSWRLLLPGEPEALSPVSASTA